ncbi:hypothetical protein AJ88_00655 [Mesorhizobium amorphae CCBAU 01583]|nr:hypothetical protein AJ88_00655 [Mesorhizobium amorphae CCBAU 01583]
MADLFASGDDHAPGVEQPEAGERRFLRFREDARQARADCREGRISIGGDGSGPGRKNSVRSEIEGRLNRPVGCIGFVAPALSVASRRRHWHAEFPKRNAGLAHILRIDGGKHGTLRDELRLCLADQLFS